MVGALECLIRAIVGKGLYEQYGQRQIGSEVYANAKVHLAHGHRHAQTPQTQGLPRASQSCASHTSCTSNDATKTPPTHIPARKHASPSPSPMKTRPSSTATLGQSPLLKPIEPALLPEYNVVHNHCSRITEHLDPADPFIMQSYQYSPLDLGPAIGFRAPTTKYRVRVPPRKVTDLEKLPPLTSEVAAEVTRNFKVRERAGILAEIRAAREKESEVQRRASRVAQMRVPSYEAQISVVFCAKDLEAALLSEPPPTPLTRRERKHLRTQPKQYLGPTAHHVGDALEQRHVRWALEPAPQGGQDSTALAKKGHHGKQTVLRNGSKRF